MTQMGDDIHEIKSDVKELKAIVHQALIKQAINGQRIGHKELKMSLTPRIDTIEGKLPKHIETTDFT